LETKRRGRTTSVGMAAMISNTRTSSSNYRSACSIDQVLAGNRQISSRSATARGASRYRRDLLDDMPLAHAQLECGGVEVLRLPALHAFGDGGLQCCECLLPLLVLADQVADIVARIAIEAPFDLTGDEIAAPVAERLGVDGVVDPRRQRGIRLAERSAIFGTAQQQKS